MNLGSVKVVLVIVIIVAGMLYFVLVSMLRQKFKDSSRARQFKVGGRHRRPEGAPEESREERQKRKEVSLRGGRLWRRRF